MTRARGEKGKGKETGAWFIYTTILGGSGDDIRCRDGGMVWYSRRGDVLIHGRGDVTG